MAYQVVGTEKVQLALPFESHTDHINIGLVDGGGELEVIMNDCSMKVYYDGSKKARIEAGDDLKGTTSGRSYMSYKFYSHHYQLGESIFIFRGVM